MAIGIEKDVEIKTYQIRLEPKDKILMCSDGLSDMVSDPEISNILNKKTSIENFLDKLIDTANDNGGKDNITCILIDNK